jgi:hypothetical protein
MADGYDENILIAHRTQDKLEFYALALTFTVLGLSIQTAKFEGNVWANLLELLGWIALLTSGLVGLRRLEEKPNLYNLFALQVQYNDRAKGIRKIESQGARTVISLEDGLQHPVSEVLDNAVTSVKTISDKLEPLQASVGKLYRIQRRTLVLGFVLLLVGRGLAPAIDIFQSMREMIMRLAA